MGRGIKIKIASEANLAAIRQVNTELVQMSFILGKRNRDLSNDARRALADYTSLGAELEKTAYKSVLSVKQIEEAWKKAMAKPTDEAARGFGKLKGIAEGAINGIGGSFNDLYRTFDITLKFSAPPRLRERYRLGAGSSRYGKCFSLHVLSRR